MSVESRYSVSCIECPKMLCKVASVRLSKNMRYFVFLAIFLSVLLPLQIFYVFLATNYDEFDIGVIYNSSREKNFTFDYITTCDLPEKDPWDPSIERFIDPSFTASNTVERRVVTALVDGVIIIRSDYKLEDCIGSCIWKTAEWNTTMDPWEPIATFQPMCDIVVVRCGNDPRNHPSYEALHSQIVEIKDKPNYGVHEPSDRLPEPPREADKPSVYVFVVDSTSASQATRELQKTFNLLRKSFDAVEFNFHNKVGLNSRPNGLAMLYGKQLYDIGASIYAPARKSAGVTCETELDDQPFIGFKFRDLGFHTLAAEEWAGGVVQYPHCKGFNRTMTKHDFKPYTQHMASKYTLVDLALHHLHHLRHDMHDYFDSFLKAYRNESQFALVWDSLVTHDKPNGLYKTDHEFAKIFKDNEKRFDNSFVFFMADHGLRFGEIRNTPVGAMEDNNPFLMISVPRKLRNPIFMDRLKTNSWKLTTQYDIHATLVQILEMAKSNDYSSLKSAESAPYRVTDGSSLFATLPEPRHCGTLNIPFEFCLCKRQFEAPIPPLSDVAMVLAETALADLHWHIQDQNATDLCRKMTVIHKETVAWKLKVLDRREEIYVLKITVAPSGGVFQAAYLLRRENGLNASMMSHEFERLDAYGGQSICVEKNEIIKPICFCKDYNAISDIWRNIFH